MDIDATLEYLDSEYLSSFEKTGTVDSAIAEQQPLPRTADIEAFYPVGAEEDCTAKTYHELSIVTGKATDLQTSMALSLLKSTLLDSESSALRRALMDAGIGQIINGSYTSSMYQPVFAIRASGSEKDLRDKFISVIYKTLQEITINGVDKKLLEANINSMEFKLREADFGGYPKGLILGIGVMDNWLYDGNPIEGLCYNKYIAALREGLKTNYYESIIENYLLDNTHKVLVTLLPQPGKEEADQEAAAAKMSAIKAQMSQEELQQHIDECAELHRLQATPDSEEARATIPVLKRSDIRQEVEQIETQETPIKSLIPASILISPTWRQKSCRCVTCLPISWASSTPSATHIRSWQPTLSCIPVALPSLYAPLPKQNPLTITRFTSLPKANASQKTCRKCWISCRRLLWKARWTTWSASASWYQS